MQTIYRNTYTTDFTVIKNDILNSELSGLAKAVLIYLLSKPPHWRLRATDIKRFLKVGINKVYRILQELRTFGYIVMQRIQSAVHWFVYDAPQGKVETATTRAESHRDGFHHDGTSDDLVRTEGSVKTEKYNNPPTVPEPIPATDTHDVVVHCDEVANDRPISTSTKAIDDIPGIEPQYQPAAKRALSRLTPAQVEMVLLAFTLQASKTAISNKTGYLIALVQSALDGSFSPVTGAQATPTMTLGERLRQERLRQQEQQERGRMSVEEHAAWLRKTYGDKQQAAQSKPAARKIGLRTALGW